MGWPAHGTGGVSGEGVSEVLKQEAMAETRVMSGQTEKTPGSLAGGWLSPEATSTQTVGSEGFTAGEELAKSSPSLFVQIHPHTGS